MFLHYSSNIFSWHFISAFPVNVGVLGPCSNF